jgi:hypothetical protein
VVSTLGILRGVQIRFKTALWEAVLGLMNWRVPSDMAWERMAPLTVGLPDHWEVGNSRSEEKDCVSAHNIDSFRRPILPPVERKNELTM